MAAADIRTCVTNLTKCSICLENFDQPKSLPCLHTFCLKCLQNLCQNVRPGRRKGCPICRKEFRIPDNGVEALPLNFDMVALMEVNRGIEYCDQHSDEALKLFCFDCNTDICVVCYALTHAQHRCEDVKTAAERFHQQIDDDAERAFSRLGEINDSVKQLDDETQRYAAEMKQVEIAIRRQGELIKEIIDGQVNRILHRMEILKNGILGDIQRQKERLELSLAAMDSFRSYAQEIKKKSGVRNMMKLASDVHDRVDDLLQSSVNVRQYRAPGISFIPTDFMHLIRAAGIEQNLIGKLSDAALTADVPSSPAVAENNTVSSAAVSSTGGNTAVRLRCMFGACRAAVRGVTVLGGELYVLRMPANNNIEVFSIDSNTLQRHLSVPRLRDAVDMASCSRHFCLYVADDSSCLIRRVDARGSGVVHDWTAGEKPSGLSVTDGRVLVTCRDSGRLKLFTADGRLLQLVELDVSVSRPCHAVELAPSGYVVCHGSQGDQVHRVCVVSADGALLASYGGPRGADAGQLDFPRHLASLGDRGVLVADFNNRRVVLLSPTLNVVSEISDQLPDFSPYRLCVDDQLRVLFVGGLVRGSSDVGTLAAFDI